MWAHPFLAQIFARATLVWIYTVVNFISVVRPTGLYLDRVARANLFRVLRKRFVVRELKVVPLLWFQYYRLNRSVNKWMPNKQSALVDVIFWVSLSNKPCCALTKWVQGLFQKKSWMFVGFLSCFSVSEIDIKTHIFVVLENHVLSFLDTVNSGRLSVCFSHSQKWEIALQSWCGGACRP